MYARVVTGQFKPGTLDEAIDLFRDSVMPELKQQQVFKGALLLRDSKTDKGITITLWETVADAQASGVGSAHLQAQFAKVASRIAAAPVENTAGLWGLIVAEKPNLFASHKSRIC